MVALREITEDNFYEVLKLDVDESQQAYVAKNVYSLAQAWLYETARPFAVYAEDSLVGFVMLMVNPQKDTYYLWRLMIDKAHQHRGYGREALHLAIAYLQRQGAKTVSLSYEKENEAAVRMYAGEGFVPKGEANEHGEIYAEKSL